jgi:hypothetical protein
MAIARLAGFPTAVASGANGFTTAGVDTTGANLLIVALASYTAGATVTDTTYGNTFTPLTQYGGSGYWSRIWYCLNPTVGAGHTVTVAGASTFDAGCLIAYSGVSALDTSIGNSNTTQVTVAPGSITPAGANELFITAAADVGSPSDFSGSAIDSGFTVLAHQAFTSGTCNTFGVAELIETTATPKNPTWTCATGGSGISATMAAFTASAGGTTNPLSLAFASASSVSLRKIIGATRAASSSGSPILTRRASLARSFSAPASVSILHPKNVLAALSVASSGAVNLVRSVGKRLSFSSASSVSLIAGRAFLVGLSIASVSAVSIGLGAGHTVVLAISAAGAIVLSRSVRKALGISGPASVSIKRAVSMVRTVAGNAALSLNRSVTKPLAVVSAGLVSLARGVGKALSFASASTVTSIAGRAFIVAVSVVSSSALTLTRGVHIVRAITSIGSVILAFVVTATTVLKNVIFLRGTIDTKSNLSGTIDTKSNLSGEID